jgi:hypothetical protein
MVSTTTTDADHRRWTTSDDYDEDADGVQGLTHVVDALSTIM